MSAIVTGGGSDIGCAIARSLAEAGVNVVIASRRKETLSKAAAELNAMGKGKAVTVICDLRKKGDSAAVVKTAKQQFGSVDILVNNSGLGVSSKIVDCTDGEWDLVLETNLTGAFLLTQPGRIKYENIGLYHL